MQKWLERFKKSDAFKKRGLIYITIAVLFLVYEVIFSKPIRTTVVLLWVGLMFIGFLVMTLLKDPER